MGGKSSKVTPEPPDPALVARLEGALRECEQKLEEALTKAGAAEQPKKEAEENAALRKRLAECEKKLEQALKETSSKPAPSAAESRPPRSWRSTSRRREDGVGTYRGASR